MATGTAKSSGYQPTVADDRHIDWETAQRPQPRQTSISAHQVLMVAVTMATSDMDRLCTMLGKTLTDGVWQNPQDVATAREFIEAVESVR